MSTSAGVMKVSPQTIPGSLHQQNQTAFDWLVSLHVHTTYLLWPGFLSSTCTFNHTTQGLARFGGVCITQHSSCGWPKKHTTPSNTLCSQKQCYQGTRYTLNSDKLYLHILSQTFLAVLFAYLASLVYRVPSPHPGLPLFAATGLCGQWLKLYHMGCEPRCTVSRIQPRH